MLLMPLSGIYWVISGIRNRLYDLGLRPIAQLPVPVIVVGNITVGGTGKTPLVLWLSQMLRRAGYRPGIIARGYGGRSETWPRILAADSDPGEVGDEPVLLARRAGCVVAVGPDRVAAARALLAAHHCDVVISDDGLQHRRLGRDIEIVVIDGHRRFGNGLLLPAGPLREPILRLQRADVRVTQGTALAGEHGMELHAQDLRNLVSGKTLAPGDFAEKKVHAVAGIGNPGRFFATLRELGLDVREHPFPDHHRFRPEDLDFGDSAPVIMTEKDAVKCERFARPDDWFLEVEARLDPRVGVLILELLKEKRGGKETA
ncbi:MAG: tetraacyldisaccharide 4'-kinase [Acidiferrobacterales bacterium]